MGRFLNENNPFIAALSNLGDLIILNALNAYFSQRVFLLVCIQLIIKYVLQIRIIIVVIMFH